MGSIRVSTLVLHRQPHRDEARYVAARIPQATVVELGGEGVWLYADDVADAVLSFLRGEALPSVPDSVLATVLFTDLVGSTERAAELGDRGWRDVLDRHHARVRSELGRYRGTEVDSAGDGFFCRFDGPARAIACASRIVEGANELGLEVRAGIHTGECELVGDKIAGISVVTGSRISSLAGPGEVLVSSTVKDLVAGSGFAFEDRGEHDLKGVPGRGGSTGWLGRRSPGLMTVATSRRSSRHRLSGERRVDLRDLLRDLPTTTDSLELMRVAAQQVDGAPGSQA